MTDEIVVGSRSVDPVGSTDVRTSNGDVISFVVNRIVEDKMEL